MGNQIIQLTKMDTRKILVNTACIQTVEASPDTVVILIGGRKLIVKENIDEIRKLIEA